MLVVIRAAFFKGVSAKGKFSNPMIFNKRFYSWDSCGIFESSKGVDIFISAKIELILGVALLARSSNFWLAGATPNRLWFP